MSKDGKQILEAVQAMRGFFKEIGLLLQTADAQMADNDWMPSKGNMATAWGSASVKKATEWLPRFAYRYYENPDYPGLLASICVIVDEVDDSPIGSEPIISGGLHDFGNQEIVSDPGESYWHPCIEGHTEDGKLHHHNDEGEDAYYSVHTFAWPLVKIQSPDDLQTLITDPLFKYIAGYKK